MRKLNHISPSRIEGFSLIEFMVASILGMIILVAVGSGYFVSRKLSDTALARLSVQQDVRNAANLIVRDARMAGSFGCFNMANQQASTITEDTISSGDGIVKNLTTLGQNTLVPIKVFKSNELNLKNFTSSSDILIFQYGVGSASVIESGPSTNKIQIPRNDPLQIAVSQTPLVFSNCTVLNRPSSYNISTSGNVKNINNINPPLSPDLISKKILNELSILRYVENAYVIGTATSPQGTSQQGLFRFQLNNQGVLSNPQLLIPSVTNMNIQYGYVNNCSNDVAQTETFEFTSTLKQGGNAPTPSIIRITLNRGNLTAITNSGDNSGNVYVYHIDATIRGGNQCADRAV